MDEYEKSHASISEIVITSSFSLTRPPVKIVLWLEKVEKLGKGCNDRGFFDVSLFLDISALRGDLVNENRILDEPSSELSESVSCMSCLLRRGLLGVVFRESGRIDPVKS